MLISKSKQFIYIHVDRTGGTTFSKAFKRYTIFQWSHRFHQLCLKVFGEIPSIQLLKEQSALELRSKVSPIVFENYFKFAMIRNPWDWMVSNYSYIQQYPHAWHHEVVKNLSFPEFVDWKLQDQATAIDPLGLNRGLSAMFTDENGEIIVDYVGKFENFEEEFNLFCYKIGVKSKLPHLNSSKYKPYREYYDDNLKETIREFFRLDIEMFDYKF